MAAAISAPFYIRHQLTANQPIGEFELKPNEQFYTSLGLFHKKYIPKGFELEVTPKLASNALVGEITYSETDKDMVEFILHAVNKSAVAASIEVWQLH